MAEAKFLLAYVGRRYLIRCKDKNYILITQTFLSFILKIGKTGVIRILICYGMLINVNELAKD